MNKDLEAKIQQVYKDCKMLVTKHEFAEVLDNNNYTEKEVWDEFAKQINYNNVFLAKQRDLEYLLTLLLEAKGGVSSNTPSGSRVVSTLDSYIDSIKGLLKTYQTISIGQRWILDYYKQGGGLR